MDHILFKHSENLTKTLIINTLITNSKDLQISYETIEKKVLDITQQRDDIKYRMELLIKAKNILTDDQEKLISKNKEKMLRLKNLSESLTEEREKLKGKLETIEYSYKILSEEYEKLRQRAKLVKFRQIEAEEEKVCKNCKKIYKEEENFNWSCKVHSSQFSGIWWCCGKKDKNASGCKVCMHESKDEYDLGLKEDDMIIDKKNFCTSCKKNGHIFSECPKDPNARTTNDINDEIERLAILVQQNSLKQSKFMECKEKHKTLKMRNKKIREFMERQFESDDERDSFFEDKAESFFPDLLALKNNTIFNTETTKYRISSEVGESPFMTRKFKSQKKSRKPGLTLFGKDRVSTLAKTISLVD
ncbi:hypothetical protein SteCoe_22708 [Stentor coeruleus]|uniref:CCHC-type domain-containing protein n=1 Tax=Stentor coeruleus TaxID=5963 RepID=A0A1R2BLK1_9CILI|nr:hypothetical protein SteCoe_22708 [Stentor coeruleus]